MVRLYCIAIVIGLVVSLVMTPVSILLARRFNVMDSPDPRKVHTGRKPRWGGIGIMAGFLFSLLILFSFFPSVSDLLDFSHGITRQGKTIFTLNLGEQLAGILFGVILLFIVGLVDDKHSLKPGTKFLFQIIAAMGAMIYGVRIHGLSIPGFESYAHFPVWLTMVVTVLWLVSMTNAVNLIDGLDGLAGGIVAIVAGAFISVALIQSNGSTLFYHQQMKLAGLIAAAILGGTLGFLVYNFFPSHVFMGDGGSLSLGFLVGCIAVIGTFKTTILAVLIVPFLLIAIPAADMTVAFGRRLINKRNPFSADRGHFHHKLLDAGWSQREVVFLVYIVTLVLALVSVTVAGLKN